MQNLQLKHMHKYRVPLLIMFSLASNNKQGTVHAKVMQIQVHYQPTTPEQESLKTH